MDPMFLPYSSVNGVPQESKLATYMKRQNESLPVAASLTKNLSTLSLNDSLPSSLKKVVPGSTEFIPRSSPSLNSVTYSSTSPLTVTSHINSSPTPTAPTYQEYVGGTTYFYSAPEATTVANSGVGSSIVQTIGSTNSTGVPIVGGGGGGGEDEQHLHHHRASITLRQPSVTMFPGTPSHAKTAMAKLHQQVVGSGAGSSSSQTPDDTVLSSASYFVSNQLRMEIQHKNNLTLATPDPTLYPDLPLEVDNYHELVPLEQLPAVPKPHLIPYSTSTYKATHIKTGVRYCLRRVHGFRLPNSKCMVLVDMWKNLSHSNIVQLREVFTTKAFGDQSIIFVYDYHPDSETLLARHFSNSDSLNGYSDSFSSNPNAPRPYSHSKNHLLRQQHTNGMLSETTIWSYVIQLTGAMAVVHALGLACRCIDPSKVLHTGRSRLRLSSPGIMDVVTFDGSLSNPLSLIPHYQQEDLTALGKLVLALACRSLIAVQRENLQTSLDLMSRTYSTDLRNLVIYLLSSKTMRSVVDLMPIIGARYYSQLDTVQYHNDILNTEMAKEMENGRLCRLLVKLGTINERPELNMDPAWSETGDRYMLKLFRDHVFHQVTEDGRPFLDMAHVVHCLNKLDAGTQEKVCLMSRDEQSVLVVTYAELKHCLEQSFAEIVASSGVHKALD
ncbi:PAN2-PAN3 deadenylation complex subunit PAN3 isoform X1 [Cimex lectularius]|uniref:PAN2-PAN3 deadenylation complex subunit PAN3 n=1 Tax=Cimex lectularius TaxID=79782 RepID=A0A8I6RAQ3_CIMLE|nr:PAN2-PAN3 deadenylation complex subunit PAN3 isoform X1 [Cimex lectularius]